MEKSSKIFLLSLKKILRIPRNHLPPLEIIGMKTNLGGLMLVKRLSIIMLALLVPVTSHATIIRQRPYSFSFEAAVAKEDEQFVVCANCPDNQLSLLPVAPKLAVRMTTEEQQTIPAVPQAPEVLNNKGATSRTSGRTETVLFDFDSAQLSRHRKRETHRSGEGLPATSTFDLTGYTCTIGTDDYNKRLSFKRAKQVAAFLTSGGVNSRRITR